MRFLYIFYFRFVVDFVCNNPNNNKTLPDIAFHFNPRFPDDVIVRNTKIDGNWGYEEREGSLVFNKGNTFVLDIYCWEEAFKVIFIYFFCYKIFIT